MNETELRTLVVGQDRNNGIVLIATNNGYFVKRYLNELSLEDQLKINNMDKEELLSYQIEILENVSADLYPRLANYDDFKFIFDLLEIDVNMVSDIFNIIMNDIMVGSYFHNRL